MENVLAIRNEYRLQQWADMIRACRESGMSIKEFCRQNGISEKTYYYRLHKLRQTVSSAAQPKLVRLEALTGQDTVRSAILLRYMDAELVCIFAVAAGLRYGGVPAFSALDQADQPCDLGFPPVIKLCVFIKPALTGQKQLR